MTIPPRDDLALMEGYHSPQVDVAVRLNTNEAPEPPPDGFAAALAAEVAALEWHRYPDRSYRRLREAIADHHGVAPEQVFAANGSNEVLRGDGVGDLDGVLGPVAEHHVAALGEGGLQVLPARRPGDDLRDRLGHALGDDLVPGDQPRQTVGAVLGLQHHVDGRPVDRGRCVGHDDHLGRTGEGAGHAHQTRRRHLSLGLRHARASGTDDHIDRPDRLRAVRQRADDGRSM